MSRKERDDILRVLAEHPDGITMADLTREVGSSNVQFQRRVRDLYATHNIDKVRRGRDIFYVLKGLRESPAESKGLSPRLRAQILHRDGSRCQMCGRSVAKDPDLVLQVDHKIPREWGGSNAPENLQTLCAECNQGKRAFFATFDPQQMHAVMGLKSVHERLARFLMLNVGVAIEPDVLQMVAAGGEGFQDDWKKRVRELRYIGLNIKVERRKVGVRRVASYRALNVVELPPDLTRYIRNYEIVRERTNRNESK